jgi:hypothetical protein
VRPGPAPVSLGLKHPTDALSDIPGRLQLLPSIRLTPYGALQVRDKKMVLPCATKESLKALPEFKYGGYFTRRRPASMRLTECKPPEMMSQSLSAA